MIRVVIRSSTRALSLAAALVFLAIWTSSGGASAASPAGQVSDPDTEEWVLKQVAAGRLADLDDRFPDEADRILSPSFLEDLLTNPIEGTAVRRALVRIAHGVLVEPLDLEFAEIAHETHLTDFRFEDSLIFSQTVFAKGLSLAGSSFEGPVDFSGMKVGGSASFFAAEFAGPVSFYKANITGDFDADGAKFTDPETLVEFSRMKVGGDAFWSGAKFAGPTDFDEMDITGDFDADGVQFESSADFNSVKIGGTVFWLNAELAGPVSFYKANITGDFDADGVQFEGSADFSSMKVGGDTFLLEAEFAGSVTFSEFDVAGDFDADGAKFTDRETLADFSSLKVGGNAFFGAEFAGPVSFAKANITGDFDADGAKFTDRETLADFSSLKVGGNAFFGAEFAGPVSFAKANITGDFDADGSRFTFAEPVDPEREDSAAESDVDAGSTGDRATAANFEGMKVGGTSSFNGAAYAGSVSFSNMQVGDTIALNNVDFGGTIQLDGMTYKIINAESDETLLELVDQSEYRPDVYSSLEAFFRRNGQVANANEVFIAQKRRERGALALTDPAWWSSLLRDYFILYGVSPHRILFVAAAFVVLGTLVFHKKSMRPQDDQDTRSTSRDYSAFWYSLDVFLPVVDLHAATVWTPGGSSGLARIRQYYMRAHTVIGWVLTTTGILALSGTFS